MQLPHLTLNMIELDPSRPESMQFQLYDSMRKAIVSRQLQPGGRLPSTRELSSRWGVSRNTVLGAFDQLVAEGYLEARQGAGTFVTTKIPESYFSTNATTGLTICREVMARRAEELNRRIGQPREYTCPRLPLLPLRPTIPSLNDFPMDIWERCRRAVISSGVTSLLTYGEPLGYWPLRTAIASYLRDSRGVRCEPSQVVLCCGSQQGIFLAASILLQHGDTVAMEDPGYNGAAMVYQSFNCRVASVRVDDEGMVVDEIPPGTRLIHVTPSHQFPKGATLSLVRRIALLELARNTGAYIVEDDYDSEYRYSGKPLACLQGLDPVGSVIYIGTFSKVLFPSLRLGYLVVPPGLVDLFEQFRNSIDINPTLLDPATLALFIEEGHFARHIRRMRSLYKERMEVLHDAARRHLAGALTLSKQQAGMHAVGWLASKMSDSAVSDAALKEGIIAPAISRYSRILRESPALVLGFAAYEEKVIRAAVEGLARVIGD
jgi:GntR family transcriptional regulator/MocR family aminotransferase